MPLHLAHHKSYHPYNHANKVRVQRDETNAAHQQAQQRTTSFAIQDHARLEALRSGRKDAQSDPTANHRQLSLASEPVEAPYKHAQGSLRNLQESKSGHSLVQSRDELHPWYSSPNLRNGADSRKPDEQRLKDAYKDSTRKSADDPLKAMQSYLAQRKASKQSTVTARPSSQFPSDRYEPDALREAQSSRKSRQDDRRSHRHPTRTSQHNDQARTDRSAHRRSKHDDRLERQWSGSHRRS